MVDVSGEPTSLHGSGHVDRYSLEPVDQLARIESATSELAKHYETTVDSLYKKAGFNPIDFQLGKFKECKGYDVFADVAIDCIKNTAETMKYERSDGYQDNKKSKMDKILNASKIAAAGSLVLFGAGVVADNVQTAYAESEEVETVTIPADIYRELQMMCQALFPDQYSVGEIRKNYVPFDTSRASVLSSSSTIVTSSETGVTSGDEIQTLINSNVDVSSNTSTNGGGTASTGPASTEKSGGHMTMDPSQIEQPKVEECEGFFCSERMMKIKGLILGEQDRAEDTRDEMYKDLYPNGTNDE